MPDRYFVIRGEPQLVDADTAMEAAKGARLIGTVYVALLAAVSPFKVTSRQAFDAADEPLPTLPVGGP